MNVVHTVITSIGDKELVRKAQVGLNVVHTRLTILISIGLKDPHAPLYATEHIRDLQARILPHSITDPADSHPVISFSRFAFRGKKL